MRRKDLLNWLEEIQTYSQFIVSRTFDHTFEDYTSDPRFRLAVEKALINIGVAATSIREHDDATFAAIPDLRETIALRNRLAHGYGTDLNDEVIWRTAIIAVPNLLADIQSWIEQLS